MSQFTGKSMCSADRLVIYDRDDSCSCSYGNKKHVLTSAAIYQPFICIDHYINVIIHITWNMKFIFDDLFYGNVFPPLQVSVGNCNSLVYITISGNSHTYSNNLLTFFSKKCYCIVDHLLDHSQNCIRNLFF